jgi:hypothetical protein
MTNYKLVSFQGKDVSVMKFVDGAFALAIPFDPANIDYQEYLKWLSEGNSPLPADEPTEI